MSSTRPFALLAGLALLVGTACAPAPAPAPAPVNTADDEAAIGDIVAGYETALNAGDLDGCVVMYASDAIFMPNDAPAQRGEAAIRAFYQDTTLLTSFSQSRFVVSTVEVSGDFAWATVAISGNSTPPGGVEAAFVSKALFVFRRDTPGWQVVGYMFNAVTP